MHTIMDRYRQADEEERLSLFLSHRELREDFIALHLEEYREKNRTVERVPYRP